MLKENPIISIITGQIPQRFPCLLYIRHKNDGIYQLYHQPWFLHEPESSKIKSLIKSYRIISRANIYSSILLFSSADYKNKIKLCQLGISNLFVESIWAIHIIFNLKNIRK